MANIARVAGGTSSFAYNGGTISCSGGGGGGAGVSPDPDKVGLPGASGGGGFAQELVAPVLPEVRHLLTLIQIDKVILEVLDTMLAVFTSMVAVVVTSEAGGNAPTNGLLTIQQVLV